MGSNLWSWQRAQAMVRPRKALPRVSIWLSTTSVRIWRKRTQSSWPSSPRVEAGGGKLVAGEVLADELGVGDVGVEGADEVVAVVVGAVDFVVPIIAESFGETHEVHPVAGPLLAEVGGAEEAVDLALVGSRGLIVFKKIDLERGGREAGENEAEATEEGGTVGLAF